MNVRRRIETLHYWSISKDIQLGTSDILKTESYIDFHLGLAQTTPWFRTRLMNLRRLNQEQTHGTRGK